MGIKMRIGSTVVVGESNAVSAQKVWQKIRGGKTKPDHRDLVHVIVHSPQHRAEACRILLEDSPTHRDLINIILWVPEFRSQFWQLLRDDSPTRDELREVYRHMHELHPEIKAMIT
ncbi:MAG TPA: hypothetical protein VJC05_03800 [Candidatus Andersenbacteria bacterium]|nr:MAG: hypothetical protein A2854_01515 [Parcubacteria group bacterium RIFCSPHIGHO2_01_FULL_56_18]HLD26138.1 hypothetical protein [Candidatus Andersenbacteria bacterium]